MYDVIKRFKRPGKELLRAFSEVKESASLYEVMGKTGALFPDIRPVWPKQRVCGSAFTVHCPAGDNLMLHKAITMIQPGDVIVLHNDASADHGGMMGEMLLASAQVRGAAGLITDAACRDTVAIEKLGFPVWCRGVSVHGTTKLLPGTINHAIALGGIVIHPGDIVFADNDGVVVVPLDKAEDVLEKALKREKDESVLLERIQRGEFITFDYGNIRRNYASLGLSEEP